MKKEIVIIGGGFAGLNLVRHLADEADIHVTLVDLNNYNFFPPLLYQLANGFLDYQAGNKSSGKQEAVTLPALPEYQSVIRQVIDDNAAVQIATK
jgi:NADH dehydrogenase